MNPRLVTPLVVAHAAGVDPRTVRRACQSGELPAEQLDGRWVIDAADAKTWIESYVRHARKAKS